MSKLFIFERSKRTRALVEKEVILSAKKPFAKSTMHDMIHGIEFLKRWIYTPTDKLNKTAATELIS